MTNPKTTNALPFLDLKLDLIFKSYFRQNERVLISLLEAFFPLFKKEKIKKLLFLPLDYVVNPYEKQSVLDLNVELKNGFKVNVEMQMLLEKNFINRVLYYWSKIYSSSLKSGESYDKLKPVYSLIITNFTLFKKTQSHANTFSISSQKKPYFELTRHLHMAFVELNKFPVGNLQKLVDLSDLWRYLLKRSDKIGNKEAEVLKAKGEDMKQAVEHLEKLSREDVFKALEEQRRRDDLIKQSQLDYKYDEGMAKGKAETRKKIALKLMAKNMDIMDICSITGLTKEHVLKLKK